MGPRAAPARAIFGVAPQPLGLSTRCAHCGAAAAATLVLCCAQRNSIFRWLCVLSIDEAIVNFQQKLNRAEIKWLTLFTTPIVPESAQHSLHNTQPRKSNKADR